MVTEKWGGLNEFSGKNNGRNNSLIHLDYGMTLLHFPLDKEVAVTVLLNYLLLLSNVGQSGAPILVKCA